MADAFGRRASVVHARIGDRNRVVDVAATAWLLVLPCAALFAVLVHVVGPPLGRLLYPAQPDFGFWPLLTTEPHDVVHPEPTEQARFLIALLAPVALAGGIVALRRTALPTRLARIGMACVQLLAASVLAACLLRQRDLPYGVLAFAVHRSFFTPATVVLAAVLALLASIGLRSPRVRGRAERWLRDTPTLRWGVLALALVATAVWLFAAVNTDASIAATNESVRNNIAFPLDEVFAVLDGLTPLADFTAQYNALWPFVVALPMLVLGKTLLVFTLAMNAITALALLSIFSVLRRVTHSSVVALVLYLPFLATSLFIVDGTPENSYTFASYFGVFPLRYAGPFLLLWLLARHLDGARPSRRWVVFLAAGLVALGNADFGLAALGATAAALVWAADEVRPRTLALLVRDALVGLLAAFALVAAVTLLRAGTLPQVGRQLAYAKVFAVGGFNMWPLRSVFGLHFAIYLTYVAVIAVGTVRAVDRAPGRLLTGLLVWSGVFGLGAANYHLTRTDHQTLVSSFSAWALALTLLAVCVGRQLARDGARRPNVAQLAVLFGMGLAACSLAQVPTPWSQLDRIRAFSLETVYVPSPATRDFVSSVAWGDSFYVRAGAPVLILGTVGHRAADAFAVRNVSRYTGIWSIMTERRLHEVIDDLRAAGGNTVLLPATFPEMFGVLSREGFEVVTESGPRPYKAVTEDVPSAALGFDELVKWVDMRNLHPAFLRQDRGRRVSGT